MPKESFIVYDCEIWSDEGVAARKWNGIRDYPPLVVQIGAALVSVSSGKPMTISTFSRYVLPFDEFGMVAPITDYFTELTKITADMIGREGVPLAHALCEFQRFCGDRYMFSFGRDMLKTILPSCFVQGLPCGFQAERCRDVRHTLTVAGVSEATILANTSGTIAQALGWAGENFQAHNALGDVESIICALRMLVEAGRLPVAELLTPSRPNR